MGLVLCERTSQDVSVCVCVSGEREIERQLERECVDLAAIANSEIVLNSLYLSPSLSLALDRKLSSTLW